MMNLTEHKYIGFDLGQSMPCSLGSQFKHISHHCNWWFPRAPQCTVTYCQSGLLWKVSSCTWCASLFWPHQSLITVLAIKLLMLIGSVEIPCDNSLSVFMILAQSECLWCWLDQSVHDVGSIRVFMMLDRFECLWCWLIQSVHDVGSNYWLTLWWVT